MPERAERVEGLLETLPGEHRGRGTPDAPVHRSWAGAGSTVRSHLRLDIDSTVLLVLEEGEVAFVMMLLNERQRVDRADRVKVGSDVRLSGCGIDRNSYAAHRALARFGLVSVDISSDRDENGRSRDFGPYFFRVLHRFLVNEGAFQEDAVEVLSKAPTLR